jgi:hypothetical protein
MLTLLLAAAIASAPVARSEDAFVSAVYASQAARAERAIIAAFLAEQDAVLAEARRPKPIKVSPFESSYANPFADDGKPDPFEAPVRWVWWTTTEIKPVRW